MASMDKGGDKDQRLIRQNAERATKLVGKTIEELRLWKTDADTIVAGGDVSGKSFRRLLKSVPRMDADMLRAVDLYSATIDIIQNTSRDGELIREYQEYLGTARGVHERLWETVDQVMTSAITAGVAPPRDTLDAIGATNKNIRGSIPMINRQMKVLREASARSPAILISTLQLLSQQCARSIELVIRVRDGTSDSELRTIATNLATDLAASQAELAALADQARQEGLLG